MLNFLRNRTFFGGRIGGTPRVKTLVSSSHQINAIIRQARKTGSETDSGAIMRIVDDAISFLLADPETGPYYRANRLGRRELTDLYNSLYVGGLARSRQDGVWPALVVIGTPEMLDYYRSNDKMVAVMRFVEYFRL